MYAYFETGKTEPMPIAPTLADGVAGNIERDSITWKLCRRLVDEVVGRRGGADRRRHALGGRGAAHPARGKRRARHRRAPAGQVRRRDRPARRGGDDRPQRDAPRRCAAVLRVTPAGGACALRGRARGTARDRRRRTARRTSCRSPSPLDGDTHRHRGRCQAQADDAAARRREPRRPIRRASVLVDRLRRGLDAPVVGPCRRGRARRWPPGRTSTAPSSSCARATRSTRASTLSGPAIIIEVDRWSGWGRATLELSRASRSSRARRRPRHPIGSSLASCLLRLPPAPRWPPRPRPMRTVSSSPVRQLRHATDVGADDAGRHEVAAGHRSVGEHDDRSAVGRHLDRAERQSHRRHLAAVSQRSVEPHAGAIRLDATVHVAIDDRGERLRVRTGHHPDRPGAALAGPASGPAGLGSHVKPVSRAQRSTLEAAEAAAQVGRRRPQHGLRPQAARRRRGSRERPSPASMPDRRARHARASLAPRELDPADASRAAHRSSATTAGIVRCESAAPPSVISRRARRRDCPTRRLARRALHASAAPPTGTPTWRQPSRPKRILDRASAARARHDRSIVTSRRARRARPVPLRHDRLEAHARRPAGGRRADRDEGRTASAGCGR